MNYSEDNAAAHEQAMKRPVAPPTFQPDFEIQGPARRRRNRNHFFLTLAVLGGLILARLVLRSLGVI